jgi:cobalt/nickel transport system permease protein
LVHQYLLSPYLQRPSLIHRLPAIWKLIGAISFVVGTVLLPRAAWTGYTVSGAALLLIAGLSRIPPLQLGKRLLSLEPFVLGVALLSLFQAGGLTVFLAMLAKSTLCLFCMILLSSTTPMSELLAVLRRFRVPGLLVTTLALTYRYLFLLAHEMERMRRARRSRLFVRQRFSAWRSTATIIAQLFVRTSERAERVYAAMCARGWRT